MQIAKDDIGSAIRLQLALAHLTACVISSALRSMSAEIRH